MISYERKRESEREREYVYVRVCESEFYPHEWLERKSSTSVSENVSLERAFFFSFFLFPKSETSTSALGYYGRNFVIHNRDTTWVIRGVTEGD